MSRNSPVICDMSAAPDTPAERVADYRRLFEAALVGCDRSDRMVRFRFRAAAVDEDEVRSLAGREQACCPFFDIQLSTVGDELWWETRVDDTPQAQALLDEFSRLPTRDPGEGIAADLVDRGLMIMKRS